MSREVPGCGRVGAKKVATKRPERSMNKFKVKGGKKREGEGRGEKRDDE